MKMNIEYVTTWIEEVQIHVHVIKLAEQEAKMKKINITVIDMEKNEANQFNCSVTLAQ